MTGDVASPLHAGREALARGDWDHAREALEQSLAQEETPEALAGLGDALVWLGRPHEAIELYERGYALLRRRPDAAGAAMVAVGLYFVCDVSLGRHAVARGWLGRAARLVDEHGLVPMQGWVQLMRAHAARGGAEAERLAREALDAGRAGADPDLALCALSLLGATLVERGRVEEGLALLDEAMAGSLGGEPETLDTVVLASCLMVTSCSRAAEFERAQEWIRVADGFARRYGSPHVHTTCRLHQGNVLLSTGRWEDAERELESALEMARTAEPGLQAEVLAKLAELRLAQGRVDEAAQLVAGQEAEAVAVPVLAALDLARGAPGAAAARVRRRVDHAEAGGLEAAALLELLVEAELAQRRSDAAAAAAGRLADLAAKGDGACVAARAARASGRLLAAGRTAGDAVRPLEQALGAFRALRMPLEAARSQLLLATALAGGDRDLAVADAQSALEAFRALGAARDADAAAALLRSLGVRVAPGGPRASGVLSRREEEVLALLGEGLTNRQIAERLFLAPKTVEHHVRSVLAKLGLRRRAEAAAYAVRHGPRGSAAD